MRYEATVDGIPAGYAQFELTDDLVVFTHTEVDPAFEGQGVGSALAGFALDDVRATGDRNVRPVCPFIAGWIQRHPEYAGIVTGDIEIVEPGAR
ncbi:MAG: GNAT family N-acetyltransferase [Actinomycetota bacterium]|nr:GNAT family N-acetyltransferase [Actinomycetota bacterium]